MSLVTELAKQIDEGKTPVIKWEGRVFEETYSFRAGMICKVTSYRLKYEDVHEFQLDFKPFERYNDQFDSERFYSFPLNQALLWRESPYYYGGKIKIYMKPANRDSFRILSPQSIELIQEWQNISSHLAYQDWLESQLRGFREGEDREYDV